MMTKDDFFGPVALSTAEAEGTPNATVTNFIYGDVVAVGGDHFVVETHVGKGTFSRKTARCLESQWRNLQHYRIAPDEMDRFATITERCRAAMMVEAASSPPNVAAVASPGSPFERIEYAPLQVRNAEAHDASIVWGAPAPSPHGREVIPVREVIHPLEIRRQEIESIRNEL